MAHFESEAFRVSFDLPDNPTARQVLAFDSIVLIERDESAIVTMWEAARAVISNWECEFVPIAAVSLDIPSKEKLSLDDLHGIEAAHAIEWAASQARQWRTALNEVPKN